MRRVRGCDFRTTLFLIPCLTSRTRMNFCLSQYTNCERRFLPQEKDLNSALCSRMADEVTQVPLSSLISLGESPSQGPCPLRTPPKVEQHAWHLPGGGPASGLGQPLGPKSPQGTSRRSWSQTTSCHGRERQAQPSLPTLVCVWGENSPTPRACSSQSPVAPAAN